MNTAIKILDSQIHTYEYNFKSNQETIQNLKQKLDQCFEFEKITDKKIEECKKAIELLEGKSDV